MHKVKCMLSGDTDRVKSLLSTRANLLQPEHFNTWLAWHLQNQRNLSTNIAADLHECSCTDAPMAVLLHVEQSFVQHGVTGGKPLQSLYSCPWGVSKQKVRTQKNIGSVTKQYVMRYYRDHWLSLQPDNSVHANCPPSACLAVGVFCHLCCASESLCCLIDTLQQRQAVLLGTAMSFYWLQCRCQSTPAHGLETELACLSAFG